MDFNCHFTQYFRKEGSIPPISQSANLPDMALTGIPISGVKFWVEPFGLISKLLWKLIRITVTIRWHEEGD